MSEVTTVLDDEVVTFDGGGPRVYDSLAADTVHDLDGIEVRTLPRRGELLCRFATVNDVHFGETVCGMIDGSDVGPVFSVPPGAEPYPELMNRAAIAEIGAIDPAVVVVKGDLTSTGTPEEYAQFRAAYEPAFGERLHVVRGNHDAYHGHSFADIATQEVELPGVRLAILDTARILQVGGSVSEAQLEWLDELGARSAEPVLVFGHHNVWNPGVDRRGRNYFGIDPDDSEALAAVVARRRNIVGYFCGHTHRNHRQQLAATGDVPWTEVACVKDFPGAWAEYRVFEGGIVHAMRRISTPAALAWTELTRHMFGGAYGPLVFGRLEDRNFLIAT